MNTLSLRVYRRLLVCYPEDLRRDYGYEMVLAFGEDLEASRRERGLRGIITVWLCVVCEFLRIALPEHASSPAVRVPAIAFALTVLSFAGEVMIGFWHDHPGAHVMAFTGMLLSTAGLASPAISLLSVWACRGGAPVSLGPLINPRREE